MFSSYTTGLFPKHGTWCDRGFSLWEKRHDDFFLGSNLTTALPPVSHWPGVFYTSKISDQGGFWALKLGGCLKLCTQLCRQPRNDQEVFEASKFPSCSQCYPQLCPQPSSCRDTLGIEDTTLPPTCCRCAGRVSRFGIYQNIIIYIGPATSCCCASGACKPQSWKVSVSTAIASLPVAVQVGSPGFKVTKSPNRFQSFSHFLSLCRQDF